MAIAAFWLAVAAFIVVGALNARRGYELKFQTIRLMMEKGEEIDAGLLRELLTPPKWYTKPARPVGANYTTMRIFGTLMLFVALGIALLLVLIGAFLSAQIVQAVGVGVGILLALVGIGLHVCCRFVPRPLPPNGVT